MPEYRRWYVPGGTYFFTVVTADRLPIFGDPQAADRLGSAMRSTRCEHPFETVAAVLLPDRLHVLWTLPLGDADFATRWRKIKAAFTHEWLKDGGMESGRSPSRLARGERGVWGRRY